MPSKKELGALSVLFEEHYTTVFRAVLLYCRDRLLAEDATQEAFLQAFKKIHTLRNKNKFPGWVFVIATNIVKKEFKKNKNTITVDSTGIEDNLSYDPFKNIENKKEIESVLKKMSYKHREALILKYCFDLSLEDIAEKTGARKGTVKSRVSRAKERFKVVLAGINKSE